MSAHTDMRAPRAGSDGGAAPARRRRAGRRTARRRQRRRHLLRRGALGLGVALLVAAVVWVALPLLSGGGAEPLPGDGQDTGVLGDPQPTAVLATYDETEGGGVADLVVVLAHDEVAGTGTVLFVPATTVADVPGHGLLQVGRAYAFGQGPLLEATLDNLLGIHLDQSVSVSRQGWASLFTRVGGFQVDLPERLVSEAPDGTRQVRFQPGPQFLDGPRLAELLTFRQPGEAELGRLPRAQRVLAGLFGALGADPDLLEAVFADGAPMLDTGAPTGAPEDLVRSLAQDAAAGTLEFRTLPVSPIGSGDDSSYRPDAARVAALVADRFAASVPEAGPAAGRRLRILNGNGVPGVGQQVAQRLLPAGFRVVLTGNADSFAYDETRIVVHGDDDQHIAAAERVRALLGVGRIERSGTPQSVVDITVVVGHDFPGVGGG